MKHTDLHVLTWQMTHKCTIQNYKDLWAYCFLLLSPKMEVRNMDMKYINTYLMTLVLVIQCLQYLFRNTLNLLPLLDRTFSYISKVSAKLTSL